MKKAEKFWLRCTTEEKDRWTDGAKRMGVGLSEFARMAMSVFSATTHNQLSTQTVRTRNVVLK